MNSWAVAVGAFGGLLYGVMSDSKRVWPKFIDVGRRRPLLHVGLIGHAVIGMAAGEMLTITILTSNTVSFPASGLSWSNVCAQLLCSFLASSTIGGYTDRRFLRLAIRNAATAPAADPATVRGLELATPFEAYVATGRLTPPPSRLWGTPARIVASAEDVSSSKPAAIDSRTRLPARLVRLPTRAKKGH